MAAQLRGQLAELQAAVDERTRELGAVDAELSALREVTIASGMTSAAVEQLRRDYEQLLAEHDALLTRWSQVIPIDSPELSGAPLLLDRGVDNVVVVRPVCTGSMEPNITCDDLLVLYAPSTLSDVDIVDIVDIIYFPKPDADCSGSVPGHLRAASHRRRGEPVGRHPLPDAGRRDGEAGPLPGPTRGRDLQAAHEHPRLAHRGLSEAHPPALRICGAPPHTCPRRLDLVGE